MAERYGRRMAAGNYPESARGGTDRAGPFGAPQPLTAACTSRRFIELVGDKWVLLILIALRAGPRRNGELRREIEGISQKVLTQALRRLEAHGLVRRADLGAVPPHVEYSLTGLGRSLEMVMQSLDRWFADQLPAYREGSDRG